MRSLLAFLSLLAVASLAQASSTDPAANGAAILPIRRSPQSLKTDYSHIAPATQHDSVSRSIGEVHTKHEATPMPYHSSSSVEKGESAQLKRRNPLPLRARGVRISRRTLVKPYHDTGPVKRDGSTPLARRDPLLVKGSGIRIERRFNHFAKRAVNLPGNEATPPDVDNVPHSGTAPSH
ncbi:hypothetical protein THASP1DRAFT_24025 [Thamnocephalis sphaerospora]|uniref:Uncharacterized protein n=1 Tax=Thamnocephalis sphaerospora TaxID=78915 RepID=A0A4P9XPI3_9FUNG|nr:hypothetical protein THASP1DRAFT_24025 [Thamnocephalis sphaerospora]|eukprot:RKP07898.1 hypothetical protein THASP1DRAFT_24025 [Thamnocephalis sphaerospora]